jgi:hypothetical protein
MMEDPNLPLYRLFAKVGSLRDLRSAHFRVACSCLFVPVRAFGVWRLANSQLQLVLLVGPGIVYGLTLNCQLLDWLPAVLGF